LSATLTVEVRYYTDPACPWSWASEPKLRRLIWEFGDGLEVRWVMAGLARQFDLEWTRAAGLVGADPATAIALHWIDVSARGGMPCDPRLWLEAPPASSYPACMAVRAACEQGSAAGHRYLRRLREGFFCERRNLDHADALRAEAAPAGLDARRFAIDLGSHAITEAFGADLSEVRELAGEAGEGGSRLPLPSAVFVAAGGSRHHVIGPSPYEEYRAAALAAGAEANGEEGGEPTAVVERLGRAATAEVEAISGKPGPVVRADLWAAARDWALRPLPVLSGELWESA
jgi:predicted DsbA family dithiol-disulfide isomerase